MIWPVRDKEQTLVTCFAIFPKRIGRWWVWLSKYYKTWDYVYNDIYSCYVPHWFVDKEDAIKYIQAKEQANESTVIRKNKKCN